MTKPREKSKLSRRVLSVFRVSPNGRTSREWPLDTRRERAEAREAHAQTSASARGGERREENRLFLRALSLESSGPPKICLGREVITRQVIVSQC